MKRNLTTLIAFVFFINSVLCQTPVITMSTSKGNGNSVFFLLKANAETKVNVDFGNGTLQEFTVESASNTLIDGALTGQTVKVYGSTDTHINYLDCRIINLTAIDVSNAIDLKWFDCHENQLTSIDITKNINLQYLNCNDNLLTTLDITKNSHLVTIQCKNNQFTFASLPSESVFTAYIYAPQKSISTARSFITGDMIDLSAQFSVGGSTTVYSWKTKSGTNLAEGTDYAITAGKTVLLKAQTDSVYCEMSNASFPDFKDVDILKTTNAKITGAAISVITMKTTQAISSSLSLTLQANTDNTSIKIDFGDGTLVSKIISTIETPISGNINGTQSIKIYGTGIIYLDCSNNNLSALDISKNTALTGLDCYNNQLSTLDVSKNTSMESLSCENNLLNELDVTKNTNLTLLYCNNNQFSNLNLINNTELVSFNCSYNKLSAIDVTKNTKLTSFTCNNNNLKALDVSSNTKLYNLTCNNNLLTFSSLPTSTLGILEYRYFPQRPISIAKSFNAGDMLDLNNQLSVGGKTTIYTLKTKSGTTLTKGTDYNITDGKINFLKAQADSVYCQMTNATFPYFSGSDALKTSYTKILEAGKQIQVITFDPLPNKNVNDLSFVISASASSGLPIEFSSSDQTVASITTNNMVFIHKEGTTIITATQAGNANWASASASQTLTITPLTGIDETKENQFQVYPNPATDILYLKGENIDNASISIYNHAGIIVWKGSIHQQKINVSKLSSGLYMLKLDSKNAKFKIIRFFKQ